MNFKVSDLSALYKEKNKYLIPALVAITVFSGDFTIGRVIPGMSRSLGEVRIWGTCVLAILVLFLYKHIKFRMKENAWSIIPLGVLCVAIVTKCIPFIGSERGLSYITDSIILFLNSIMICMFLTDQKSANRFMLCAIMISMCIFWVNLFNLFFSKVHLEYQLAMGTNFTFNRLLLFGSIAALVVLYSKKHTPLVATCLALLSLLFLFGALISMSKAAFIAGLCATLWLSIWIAAKRQYRKLLFLILSVIIVYTLFFFMSSIRLSIWIGNIGSSFNSTGANSVVVKAPNLDKSDRIPMIVESVRIIRGNPLWGAGPNAFQIKKSKIYLKDEISYYTYPHNVVLELCVLGGLFMGSLLLFAVLGPFVPVFRQILKDDRILVLSTAMIVFGIESLVGGDLYDFRLFWYAAILIPVYTLGEQYTKTPNRQRYKF